LQATHGWNPGAFLADVTRVLALVVLVVVLVVGCTLQGDRTAEDEDDEEEEDEATARLAP